MRARAVGVVLAWDRHRHYGFVGTDDGSEFFAHEQSLVDQGAPPAPGEIVEFVATESPRGPRAERVRRLPPTCPKCEAELLGLRCSECGFWVGTR
jgi:cold shock CspA family protein